LGTPPWCGQRLRSESFFGWASIGSRFLSTARAVACIRSIHSGAGNAPARHCAEMSLALVRLSKTLDYPADNVISDRLSK